jgi:hypothetical protein
MDLLHGGYFYLNRAKIQGTKPNPQKSLDLAGGLDGKDKELLPGGVDRLGMKIPFGVGRSAFGAGRAVVLPTR